MIRKLWGGSTDLDVGLHEWNPRLREQLGEELVWFRLGFNPTYQQIPIFISMERVLHEWGVAAYAVYEMVGIHDLMLKVWLPPAALRRDFEADLFESLRRVDLVYIDYAVVAETLRHPIWSEAVLGLSIDDLSSASLPSADHRRVSSQDRTWLFQTNAVKDFDPPEGIRFFVIVPHPTSLAPSRFNLVRLVDRIVEEAASEFQWLCLYDTTGFGTALIDGVVAPGAYHRLYEKIIDPLIEATSRPGAVRTISHICTRHEPIQYRDEIYPDVGETNDDDRILEFLGADESAELEFKGSAFGDTGEYYYTGSPYEAVPAVTDSMLKSVVGMLNSGGGRVVIGVLEAKRFTEVSDDGPLKGASRHGEYLYPGVVFEMKKGWDEYERRLLDVFRHRIEPDPHARVSISKLISSNGEVLAEIAVERASFREVELFYRIDGSGRDGRTYRFFIRNGSQSRELSGPNLDRYKDVLRLRVEESQNRRVLSDIEEHREALAKNIGVLHDGSPERDTTGD